MHYHEHAADIWEWTSTGDVVGQCDICDHEIEGADPVYADVDERAVRLLCPVCHAFESLLIEARRCAQGRSAPTAPSLERAIDKAERVIRGEWGHR